MDFHKNRIALLIGPRTVDHYKYIVQCKLPSTSQREEHLQKFVTFNLLFRDLLLYFYFIFTYFDKIFYILIKFCFSVSSSSHLTFWKIKRSVFFSVFINESHKIFTTESLSQEWASDVYWMVNLIMVCHCFRQVRQGLKEYSNWPTYPQVYVKGELIGGLDIITVRIEFSSCGIP